MNDLQALAEAYAQIDNSLESLRKAPGAHIGARNRISDRQHISDQANFVLACGQIESEIDPAFRNAIRPGPGAQGAETPRSVVVVQPG